MGCPITVLMVENNRTETARQNSRNGFLVSQFEPKIIEIFLAQIRPVVIFRARFESSGGKNLTQP
ncbi:MAG TPA: hypothetical protein VGH42_09215 [Verrucomicrobiae bacterium]